MFWKSFFVVSVLAVVIGAVGMLLVNEYVLNTWARIALGGWLGCAISAPVLVLRK